LRIIKHAKEANFKLATGQLHGVFAEKNVEITNCYAVPNKEDDVKRFFLSFSFTKLHKDKG